MTMRVSQVESLALAAKLGEVPVGGQVGFLQHVLRVGIVANDRAGGAEQRRVVGAHEALEGVAVAAENASDERGVVFERLAGGATRAEVVHWHER